MRVYLETSVVKLGEYAIVLTDQETGLKSSEIVWFPRPPEAGFVQNLTSIKEGSKLDGIIAFECYLEPKGARSLQSDPEVLLVDPLEDQQMLEVKKSYESKGFDVQFDRPFFEEIWKQYAPITTHVQVTQNGALSAIKTCTFKLAKPFERKINNWPLTQDIESLYPEVAL